MAALRLAAEHGLGQVTVEAIADAAGVSRRTFSNYFASKEEALFYGDLERLARLIELVNARPPGEPGWTAFSTAVTAFVAEGMEMDPEWRDRRRLVRGHPSLAAYQMAVYASMERKLAAEMSRRLPPGDDVELRARVLAAQGVGTVRAATETWVENPELSLLDLVRRALAFGPPE